MEPLSQNDIEAAAQIVYRAMSPTPQYSWPLLSQEVGCDVWVKHENHTPTGAFKIRGGLTFIDWLHRTHPDCKGIITATRGNHGQSQAFAARQYGLRAVIVVPQGNSTEKNAAMKGFGGELIIHGQDFDEARLEAERLAAEMDLFLVPSFHEQLVRGVATYGLELFQAVRDLDVVFVPIGCGSGICATIMARDALGLSTKIIGVVSENAQACLLSKKAGKLVETDTAKTFADGVAVRVPVAEAFEIYGPGTHDIVSVSDRDVADAIRLYYRTTHNLVEGAGAAPLAALMNTADQWRDKKVGIILCGQNIDAAWFQTVMSGDIPSV